MHNSVNLKKAQGLNLFAHPNKRFQELKMEFRRRVIMLSEIPIMRYATVVVRVARTSKPVTHGYGSFTKISNQSLRQGTQ